MCLNVLGDSRLYELLLKCDEDLAATARRSGCSCGGTLHSARYARKPRGWAVPQPERYDLRESFCCAKDGCRKRTTPPSVRFLGPKVYLGAVVALMIALRHGANARRLAELRQLIPLHRRTLARWRTWWREIFTTTPFWHVARALLMPPVSAAELPASLLVRFAEGEEWMRLARFLDFIKPVTTRSGGRNSMVG